MSVEYYQRQIDSLWQDHDEGDIPEDFDNRLSSVIQEYEKWKIDILAWRGGYKDGDAVLLKNLPNNPDKVIECVVVGFDYEKENWLLLRTDGTMWENGFSVTSDVHSGYICKPKGE